MPLSIQAGAVAAIAFITEAAAPPKCIGPAPYAKALATHQYICKQDAPQVQTRNAAGHPLRVRVEHAAQLECINLGPCPPKDKCVSPLESHDAPPPGGLLAFCSRSCSMSDYLQLPFTSPRLPMHMMSQQCSTIHRTSLCRTALAQEST
jgi:hypothetical protein